MIEQIFRDLRDGLAPTRLRRVVAGPGRVLFLTGTLSNIITISISLFAMVAYDKVFPHDGTATLIALSVVTLALLGLDTGLRSLRSKALSAALFEASAGATNKQLRRRFVTKSNSKSIGEKSYFEEAVESLTKIQPGDVRTATLMVDLPLVIVLLVGIYLIAGALVWVPILALAAMLVVTVSSLQKGKDAMQQAEVDKRRGLQQIAHASQGADWFFGMGGWDWIRNIDSNVRRIVRESAANVADVNSFRQIATQVISQMITIGTIFFGFLMFRNHEITVGGVIATSILSSKCLGPLGNLAQLSSASAKDSPSTDAPTELTNALSEDALRMPLDLPTDWQIHLENLEFTYPGRPKASLNIQNLKIQAREKIALIGHSGSGKTTLVRLLAGSLETGEGQLTWSGLPINEISPDDWERFCVYVPQVPWTGAGSVFDQIRLGRADITDGQIGGVLQGLGMPGFAAAGADNLSAAGLSTGQMQVLGLARCLVRQASLLILDEPTNSLDADNEQAVLKAIFERYKDSTIILVTHKKNLIGMMDRAIVMEAGSVKASGAIQKTAVAAIS